MTLTRIQRKRTRNWRMPENTVCVDRSTPFGNPFPIYRCKNLTENKSIWQIGTWEGSSIWFRDTKEEATDLSVKAFRSWFLAGRQETLREKAVIALKGKNLACWCANDQPCHADVLLEYVNE